jgi:diguanylate cyclase (GGDEF)-like protein
VKTRAHSTAGFLGAGPLRPLLAFLALSFGAITITPADTRWDLVGVAALISLPLLAAAVAVPWQRLPSSLLVLPAIGSLAIVALLRHSEGGAKSGFGPLALLPVAWVALVVGRRAVLVISLVATSMVALPIVIFGAPMYASTGWRSSVVWMVVSTAVGLVVAAVVAEQREQAVASGWHAEQVAETLEALEATAGVARDISSGVDARERICAAAVSSLNATMATVIEHRDGVFALTGAAGVPIDLAVLQQVVQPSASLAAYHTQERVLVPDVAQDAGITPLLIESTGIVSALFEPIMRRGAPVGVLAVGWRTRRETLDAKAQAVASFLAAEAGSAIERSDLLARLDALARTDELTSLANRRAWDDAIAQALEQQGAFCIAMLDIDHFKAYNDEHGHLAGDQLLQRCASAWRAALRPGDLLARYGGEEFAVLLRGCPLAHAHGTLERVRHATPAGVTCSLGVSERRDSDSADDLVARADSALYDAKRGGRNRLAAAA